MADRAGGRRAASRDRKATAAHRNIPAGAYKTDRAASDLAGTLAAGADVPADLGRQLWDDVRAVEQAGLARECLWQASEALKGQLAEAKREHADGALKVLHDELARVITEVRQLEPALGNVRSAEAAIDAGKAQEWARLTACAKRHGEVRLRQHDVVVGAGVDRAVAGPLIERAGRVKNMLDLDPLATRIATGKEVPDPAPRYGGSSIEYLRWLANPNVEPWVPSVKALQAAAVGQDRAVADAAHARAVAAGTAGPAAVNRDRLVHRRLSNQIAARRADSRY